MAAVSFFSQSPTLFTIPAGGASENSLIAPRITHDYITALEDDSYTLIAPIPIEFERAEYGYVASFLDANIAVPGETKLDARRALEVEILDAFDDWTSDESALGIGPTRGLAVLKQYIAKKR